MDKYWIVWKNDISPKDIYLVQCAIKSDAIKIASYMEGIEYTHARNINILQLDLSSTPYPSPDMWLAYKKNHTYQKNYHDIVIYYGTEKLVRKTYADMWDIETKKVGTQKMDVFTIKCMEDTDSESDESDENESTFIKSDDINITNKNAISVTYLLEHLNCNNKYFIHHYQADEEACLPESDKILFVDDYMDFHTIIIDEYNHLRGVVDGDILMRYKSYSNTSCIVYIDCYEYTPSIENYQIFGVDTIKQNKLRKSIEKSLNKLDCKLIMI